jgi:probable phosphoglycerate mutase
VQHGLEEISAGELEMRADEEAVTSYLDAVAAWLHGDLDHTMPGGPDGHAFLARYDAAVRAVCEPHPARATVALVSHGAAIRTYTGLRASGPTATEVSERRIGNTGAVVLEGGPDRGWRVVRWSSEPLGGAGLADTAAHDVTGEAAEEAVADAADTAAHLGRR